MTITTDSRNATLASVNAWLATRHADHEYRMRISTAAGDIAREQGVAAARDYIEDVIRELEDNPAYCLPREWWPS